MRELLSAIFFIFIITLSVSQVNAQPLENSDECSLCMVSDDIIHSITLQIIVILIIVIILVVVIIVVVVFLLIKTNQKNTTVCCCCEKEEKPDRGIDSCFAEFDVTYQRIPPSGGLLAPPSFVYDVTIVWRSNSNSVDLEFQTQRSTTATGSWQPMGNTSPLEIFKDLPPIDRRTWKNVLGNPAIRCNEDIIIRGVCKDASGAIVGYSQEEIITIPC